jgi:LacI family transcriptional regulator
MAEQPDGDRSQSADARPSGLVDVARAAGVSRATAARALGGYGAVSEDTRARVLAAALKLDYRPNSIARRLVTGRSRTVGFVVADIGNPFFAQALRGASDIAQAAGFEVVIANTDEDARREQSALRLMGENRLDGVVVAPADLEHARAVRRFMAGDTPVVLIDRAVRGVQADAVLVDNVAAARLGVEHLIAKGHRRIGLITSPLPDDRLAGLAEVALDPLHAVPGSARAVGYLSALREAGIEPDAELIAPSRFDHGSAAEAAARLLSLPRRPTAIFSVDNVRTLGAVETILDSGLSFPGDVSLLAFDDMEWTTVVRPALTVVAQPAYDLGATAMRRLLARVDGDRAAPQVLLLRSSLIERASVAVVQR